MQFTPLNDEEIKELGLLADGDYKAKIFDAFDKDADNNQLLTKNGNEKIQLVCDVFDDKDRPRKVNAMITPAFIKLFKHCCDALNLEKEYSVGNVTALD